jgi:tetratricopeptide (TPR) repeat protein
MKFSLAKPLAPLALLFILNMSGAYCSLSLTDDSDYERLQDSSVLKTLYDSARFYSRTDPVLSKNLLQRLITVSKGKDSSRLYEYFTIYANASLNNGDFNEAEYYYRKSLSLDQQRKDTLEQVRIYNNLSHLYLLSGKLDLSVENSHEGIMLLEMMRKHGTLPKTITQFGNKSSDLVQSFFYTSIGQINMKAGNYREAAGYYNKALHFTEKSKDKIYYASALNDLALAYRHLKEYDQALKYCKKAISINKEIDNEYGIGLNYQVMGDIYALKENFSDANSMLREGMEILEKSNDLTAKSMTLLSIVGLDIKLKQYDKAEKNLKLCYDLAHASGDLEVLSQYYYHQFQLDSIKGSVSNALASFIKYHELNGRINNSRMNERIYELQTTFEMQQHEQENMLLKSENEIQQMRIDKSRVIIIILCVFFSLIFMITLLMLRHQQLLTKHKIIELKLQNLNQQMNPHFIYNCLTSIQSFIFQNDVSNSLEYLSKFSRLMRKILEGSQKQYMSVQDEIEALTLYLKLESIRFKGKFNYEITIDDKIDPIQFKIPSLLLQPFVENSVWHGIQNKQGIGKIQISFNLSQKSIFCTIEDNGIGREHAGKLKHADANSHISLGASISQDRVKLLKSLYGSKLGVRYVDLKDQCNKPSGTRVELYLPILN